MRHDSRKDTDPERKGDANPGSHPVGTGVGAASGGTAGAAMGAAVGGPVGAVVGAALGAVSGGAAGHAIAEMVDPVEEEAYWRAQHVNEPYYSPDYAYESFYGPAYRAGYEGRVKYHGRPFDEVDDELRGDYARFRGNDMTWEEARPATRAAWDRVDRRVQNFTRN